MAEFAETLFLVLWVAAVAIHLAFTALGINDAIYEAIHGTPEERCALACGENEVLFCDSTGPICGTWASHEWKARGDAKE